MKKGLLFLLVGLFVSTFSFGQIDEDFETQPTVASGTHPDVAIDGWENVMAVGTRAWQARQYGDPVNRYAQLSAYNSEDVANEAWLVTPAISFAGTGSQTLSFDYNSGYDNGFALSVWYCTDFDGTTGTWTDITSEFTIPAGPTDTYGTIANVGTYDMSSLSGTYYFGFKYSGSASGVTTTVQLDNIVITGGEISVGINEMSDILSVYPNPVKDVLNISENANVKVMNLAGQIVLTAQNVNTVNFTDLVSGMYIVSIETNEGTRVKKVIKN